MQKPLSYYANRIQIFFGLFIFLFSHAIFFIHFQKRELTQIGIKFYILGTALSCVFIMIAVVGFNRSLDSILLILKGKTEGKNEEA